FRQRTVRHLPACPRHRRECHRHHRRRSSGAAVMLGIGLSPLRTHPGRWWPEGAVYAADFVSNRYMRNGVEIPAAAAFSFSRASGKVAPDRAGAWHSFPPDVPARTNRGLLLEGAETYYPTNAAFAGLVPGTIGAGGALATGWECSIGGG